MEDYKNRITEHVTFGAGTRYILKKNQWTDVISTNSGDSFDYKYKCYILNKKFPKSRIFG